jgi:hypothetical protein
MKGLRTHPIRRLLVLAAVPLVIVTACGGDDDSSDSTSSGSKATSSTTDAPATTDAGAADAWARKAAEFRDQVGESIDIDCTADGTAGTVWGTNVYTDDSSICTAAVQVGLITFDEGGEVTIEVVEAQEEYVGSEANGVTSKDYGPWPGSFSFPEADELEVEAAIDWGRAATFYADRDASEFTVECEPAGTAGNIWGTEVYTADSSICTAAVHAGLITLDQGGTVSFELVAGQEQYQGSEANGITSSEYGSYGESFSFVEG